MIVTIKYLVTMKEYLLMALFAVSLFIPQAHTQWVVTDLGNFASNIADSIKEITTASKAVKNTLSGFKEVEKLYNDARKYYDTLKQMNNLIGDAYKMKECILMVEDMSEIYVTSYKKMLAGPDFHPTELIAMAAGYAKLLELSDESLKGLKSVAKSRVFPMSDNERMQMIDRIYTALCEYRSIVSYYTRKSISVSYVCAHKKNDLASVKALYGNPENRCW